MKSGDDTVGNGGNPPPVVVLLAGGAARRMGGGDKGLRIMGDAPILRRVLDMARSWTDRIVLSANDDPARFTRLDWLSGLPVLADGVPGRPGPLAGILAAMDWAARCAPDSRHVLSLPCDTPFLPASLWPALAAVGGTGVTMAAGPDGSRHPTVALWPVALRQPLLHALKEEGLFKVGAFAARHGLQLVPFPPGPGGIDPFFNINSPDDLARAETMCPARDPA